MKIQQGLFDHIVVQRNSRNVSDAQFSGLSSAAGKVVATVRKGNKPLKGFNGVTIGEAARGRFKASLKGLPAGGPYDVVLQIKNSGNVVDTVSVSDVLVGDVWIVAGQSNAQGCGLLKDGPGVHHRVRAFYMDDKWRTARDPIHNMWSTVDQVHIDLMGGVRPGKNTITGTGPGVAFGQSMHDLTGVPQGVIACGHGGTTMAQWDPQLKKLGSKSLYGAMMRRFHKNGGKVAGVIWYQGCSDADLNAAPVYTEKMKKFVASLRRDFGNPRLPLALVQIGRVIIWGMAAPWNSIQDQQRMLPKVIKNIATVPAIDLGLDDGIHISGKDQITLGARLASAMMVLTAGRKAGKAQITVSKVTPVPDITRNTTDFVVEFDNVTGYLVSTGRPSGFSVVAPNSVADYVYDIRLRKNAAIVRTNMVPSQVGNMHLYYGFGTNPYCNIQDEAQRPLPVFGPFKLGRERATTSYVRAPRISRFMPGAGKLHALKYPRNKKALKFQTRSFGDADFCSLHTELEKLAPEDVTVFYACEIKCDETMSLAALLGYDGPVKLWIDGKLKFHDPKGTNPAIADSAKIKFKASKGVHEVMVALGSNSGAAWGIFLAFERFDVSRRQLKKGPGNYGMPKIIG